MTTSREPSPRPASRTIILADGSTVVPNDGASVIVRHDAAKAVLLELRRGTARFEIVHDPRRRLIVNAGEIEIRVVGTSFTVGRSSDGTDVIVHQGRVLIEREGSAPRALATGARAWFPAGPTAAPVPDAMPAPLPEPTPVDWRDDARAGRYEAAWEVLSPDLSAPRGPDELFLAADTARLTGHAENAVTFLARFCEESPAEPRAPLAAFTLGRVRLSLGRPREAAAAFALAGALAPTGSLASDALAREAEAWHMAGQPDLLKARVHEYLRRFPDGDRAATLKQLLVAP